MLLYKWNGYFFQLLWIGPLVTIPYVVLQFRRNSDVLKSRTSLRKVARRACARIPDVTIPWASCQIRKIPGAHAPGMPRRFSQLPQVSDPDMHHGTCVTHVPWCMSGSLTSGFLWNRRRGKTFPAFPAHAQPAIFYVSGKRPMIWSAELSEWTCVCRTVWFVELVYCACVSNVRNPYVNSSAVNQREYRTFDVIKSIAIEFMRTQPDVHKVSTILGAVMDSRNSKTIVQRRSDSGRRLRDDCECNTGPDLDPN